MKRSNIRANVFFDFTLNHENKEEYLKQVDIGGSINAMILDAISRKGLSEAKFTLKNHKNTVIGNVQLQIAH
jgi:hypothetical protein